MKPRQAVKVFMISIVVFSRYGLQAQCREECGQETLPVSTQGQPMRFAFVATWDDGNVRTSFTDLGTVAGQVCWFANCPLVHGSEFKANATPAPTTEGATIAPSSPFVWKGDCSNEAAFTGGKTFHPSVMVNLVPSANEGLNPWS